jgi:DNA-binding response OmpR family regulator
MSGAAGPASGPAEWSDAAESPADSHGALLTVLGARDGRFPAIIGYLLPPGQGAPADPAEATAGRVLASPAGLVIDRGQRSVLLDGREIELAFQEFELLEFLAAHPYRVFTRGQIITGTWASYRPPTSRTVDIHIHRLRRKLGPGYGRCLITVQRVGYMFRPLLLAATP